jgi:hypothetical protein
MLASLGATGVTRGRVQARDVVMVGRAWQVPRQLPGWQVSRDPRSRPAGHDSADGQVAGLLARRPCWTRLAGIIAARPAGALAAFWGCRWPRYDFRTAAAGT